MKRRKTRRYKVSTVSPAHGNGNWLMVCARELIHNSVHASLISPRVHIVMLDRSNSYSYQVSLRDAIYTYIQETRSLYTLHLNFWLFTICLHFTIKNSYFSFRCFIPVSLYFRAFVTFVMFLYFIFQKFLMFVFFSIFCSLCIFFATFFFILSSSYILELSKFELVGNC